MTRSRTIARHFGGLFALIVGLIAVVCGVVVFQMQGMRVDSRRVLEESREQAITARIAGQIAGLENLFAREPDEVDEPSLEHAQDLIAEIVSESDTLEDRAEDPSRDQHQAAEEGLSDRVIDELEPVLGLLPDVRDPDARAEIRERLGKARHYAEVLVSETKHESELADLDLQKRAKSTTTIMLATLVLAVLVLLLALAIVLRGVVGPLRTLREGAEQFGLGDLERRIHVTSFDELGILASSFNEMADRLAGVQKDLERRVQERTREFLRAARLADLGVLASGVAHEINTPLASITSSAEGLERRAQRGALEPQELSEYVSVIVQEARRAHDITTRMLALARQEPSPLAPISLRIVLDQVRATLQHRVDLSGVPLEIDAEDVDLRLNANGGELVQILVNLVSNAIDASAPGDAVTLRVCARDARLAFEVLDHGHGIPEESLDRVFEPFFSSKSPGEGTGLGLALVAALVDSHGGRISVDSKPGEGTSFRVELPRDWSPAA